MSNTNTDQTKSLTEFKRLVIGIKQRKNNYDDKYSSMIWIAEADNNEDIDKAKRWLKEQEYKEPNIFCIPTSQIIPIRDIKFW